LVAARGGLPHPCPYGREDAFSRQMDILVLPDPNRLPTGVSQALIGVGIASPITRHFVGPILAIPDSRGVMFGAAMPEAPVEEDCDFRPTEDQVGRAAESWKGSSGDSISEPESMDRSAKRELGGCVTALVRLHARAHTGIGGPRLLTGIHPPIIGRRCAQKRWPCAPKRSVTNEPRRPGP
jgi:hypothetical protein